MRIFTVSELLLVVCTGAADGALVTEGVGAALVEDLVVVLVEKVEEAEVEVETARPPETANAGEKSCELPCDSFKM
jgi:hypothetical protein